MSRSLIHWIQYDSHRRTNDEPVSGANGGGRTPFAGLCVVDRRHRSLLSFSVLKRRGYFRLNVALAGQIALRLNLAHE
jgi:hypothetical protein